MVHYLGALLRVILNEFDHQRPSTIAVPVGTLQVLTLGSTPRQKLGKDWKYTKQVACLLLMHLRGMVHKDFARLGANTVEILTKFVQTQLISSGQH